jgi:RNA polymerase sigma factor (sigma-70 family)
MMNAVLTALPDPAPSPPPAARPEIDAELAAALAADLDGAFERLVLAHQDRLYTIALRLLGDPRDAEEVAQDALVRAYRAIASYDGDRVRALALRAWLGAIVVNLARNRYRRRPRPTAELPEDRRDEDQGGLPHEVAARHDAERSWARLLASLPPLYRAPVVLRHVDGLSFAEIADVLGRPEGTVKAQVHRGLVRLRTAYLDSTAQARELTA